MMPASTGTDVLRVQVPSLAACHAEDLEHVLELLAVE
jgi:hypothetical protein